MRWIVRGDVDGFFGLALDNLVNLLLIVALCQGVLQFDDSLLYGRVFPGVAVSLLFGNLFYSWQALRLARREGRDDVCALPYGINTPSLFAYVFLVMAPARAIAQSQGHPDPSYFAWQVGLIACAGSGLIEFLGSFVAERIRRASPRAALLSTLSGIALGFISLTFVFRTFERPIVGFVTLGVVCLVYFGRVHFKGGLPGGLVAVALGTLLAWITGIAGGGEAPAFGIALVDGELQYELQRPQWFWDDILAILKSGEDLWIYASVIIPMGLFNLIGSLQNVESAEAAGDRYRTGPSLAVNGLGTVAASLFGSCFPTTIYIGHPGWKAMGARAGYSVLNGVVITVLCLFGLVAWLAYYVPVDAGMAIVLWIGVVITAQAFQATPRAHAPAVVLGILPGVAAWGAMLVKHGMSAAGLGFADPMDARADELMEFLRGQDVWLHGALALEQGFIFAAVIWAGAVVAIIERRFRVASAWCAIACGLCLIGLMHSYEWTPTGTTMRVLPVWTEPVPWPLILILLGVVSWLRLCRALRLGAGALAPGLAFAAAILGGLGHFWWAHREAFEASEDLWASAREFASPALPWAAGYAAMALLFVLAPALTRPMAELPPPRPARGPEDEDDIGVEGAWPVEDRAAR